MIQARGGNVDLVRASVSFVGKRRAAKVAESSKRARVGFVSMWCDGLPFKVCALHDDPGHGLRSRSASAILAMAIGAHTWFAPYRDRIFPQ